MIVKQGAVGGIQEKKKRLPLEEREIRGVRGRYAMTLLENRGRDEEAGFDEKASLG